MGHPGKENTVELEEICEPRLVHRRAKDGGVNLVQPVVVETATKVPRMVEVDVVRLEGVLRSPWS